MAFGLTRLHESLLKVLDWTCLQNCKLQKYVVGLLIFDFIFCICLLVPTMMVRFVYVNSAGAAGYVDDRWVTHRDIFRYRRFQPWELLEPVDWQKDNRTEINSTRIELDDLCSSSGDENNSIPGDAIDYLKKYAGHPNTSGYNDTLKQLINLWTTCLALMYFTSPLLLLSLWWRKERLRLVGSYVILRCLPLLITVIISIIAYSEAMCALDIIYDGHRIRTYALVFTLIYWLYELCKFLLLALYCIEQNLAKKRKDYGFRRKRVEKPKKGSDQAHPEKSGEVDVEKILHKEKKLQKKNEKSGQGTDEISAKMIARNILELGTTTEDESVFEEKLKEEEMKEQKEIMMEAEGRKSLAAVLQPPKRKTHAVTFNDL